MAGFFSAVAFAEGKWAVLATVNVTCRLTADCLSFRLLFAATSAALGPDFFSERLKNAFFQAPEPHVLHGHTGRFAMPNGPFRGAVCAVLQWRMCRIAMAYGPFRPADGRFRHFVSWFACCRSVNFQHIMFTPPWPADIEPPWPSARCRGGAARRPQAKKALPPPCFLRFY